MSDATAETGTAQDALYVEVQRFYARHMQLLDDGRAREWAETFTEDGEFAPEHRPDPVVGREALAGAVRASYQELVEAGEVRRHWHGMVDVQAAGDGSLHVRCYALIVATPSGREPHVKMSCVCEDVLVREAGELKVSRRRVKKDGVAPPV